MPTITQLPAASSVTASDLVPVSQGGVARSASLGTVLASAQPAILVNSGVLLGRTSLGPGGPEPVTIGTGLVLSGSTLTATAPDYSTLPTAASFAPTDSVIIQNGSNGPQQLGISQIRNIFSAGTNVSISNAGVISTTATGGTSAYSIGSLPSTAAAAASDLVGISQSGTDHAITYSNLINGQTIDTAQPAAAVSDGDSFWVAQGSSTMLAQTISALWPWVQSKLVSFKIPTVEITGNTTIDGTVHNARILLCSQPVTLTPLVANMGAGFHCEVINLSGGSVIFSGTVVSSSGSLVLLPGQTATLRCLAYSGGSVIYAYVGNGGGTPSVPGTVSGVASSGLTANSITLIWNAPTSGGTATAYTVEYRLTGTSAWTVIGQTITASPYTVTGLSAATSYDVCVFATNASGSSPASVVLTVATTSAGSAPGMPTGLTASGATATSVQLAWMAPTTGGAPSSYTVEYRITGTSAWSMTIPGIVGTTYAVTGLTASTSYDFSVFASNTSGAGPISAVVTTTTTAPAGAVTSIVWNVAPSGSYTHGSGVIGVNAHVTPSTAAVHFGFSASGSTQPSAWTAATYVNTDLWGAYVPVPTTTGTWYAWASGTDGSAPTPYATPFTVI